MLLVDELDCAKWIAMHLNELVPARMALLHVLAEARVLKRLDLDLLALAGLVVLEALAQRFIQVGDFVVLALEVLNRRAIARSDELDASDGTLAGLRTA